ncbi:glycosyltransferase family 61 protein [Methylobacterium flocculans]|uniref:glycosyltransferase family 61 protein n=1 Tax=Methylobacterium flocculans TaxID=2984843 RepID=UPI0021F250E1|nr:glycosyltransferase family 61 protein [Methylobacterium sp. FF17]
MLILQDLIYVPEYAALYTRDGVCVDETAAIHLRPAPSIGASKLRRVKQSVCKHFPPKIDPPSAEAVFERPIVQIGHVAPHYGHFVVDGLARMWALSNFERQEHFYFTDNRKLSSFLSLPYVAEAFAALDFDPKKIARFEVNTLLKTVIIALPGINYSYNAYDALKHAPLRIAERLRKHGAPCDGQPIYISRTTPGSGRRKLNGEEQVEEAFRSAGYKIFHPERHTLSEQIEIFSVTRRIVGSIGSAFHSMLFEPDSFVGERFIFSPTLVNGRFLIVDGLKQDSHRTVYIRAIQDGLDASGRSTSDIDADLALSHARSLGLL